MEICGSPSPINAINPHSESSLRLGLPDVVTDSARRYGASHFYAQPFFGFLVETEKSPNPLIPLITF